MSFKPFAVVAAAAALVCIVAAPARAQGVKLRFHDGLVTLSAQNAPLRTILAEWARLGGTTVVNAERVVGPPLTLELNAVPEAQALAVLLRSVSGYMAALRAAGTPGASVYDRVLILPTSSAPRNPPPQPAPGFQPGRPVMPQPRPVQPEPEPDERIEEEEPPVDDDVPPVNPFVRPRNVPGGRPQPFPVPVPNVQPEPGEDPGIEPEPEQEAAPQPGNPFGVPPGTTSRPGVITPVPQQPEPQRTQPDPEP